MNNTVIGLDLAKNVFHVVELDHRGKLGWRKKFSRSQLKRFFANYPPATIAMEACASAHYWARLFRSMEHEVKLLPPQHVKGYLRGQKNDYNDARAIAEGSLHGAIHPVRVKTVEQQDEQAFHALRRSLNADALRLSNQLRGLLAEYGITIPRGVAALQRGLPAILADAENGLSPRCRELLDRQSARWQAVREELAWYDRQLALRVKEDEVCQRLLDVPGVGSVVASVLKNWMGDGSQFRRGRDASAALGLVPRQYSTGGKEVLLGITKRGDASVRAQVAHGARAVVSRVEGKTDPLSRWVQRVKAVRGFNKAVIALANKIVRIVWVLIARGETYRQGAVAAP